MMVFSGSFCNISVLFRANIHGRFVALSDLGFKKNFYNEDLEKRGEVYCDGAREPRVTIE